MSNDPQRSPFSGREEELERMFGILRDVMLQNGTLLIISGEAGIGKTRIVEEFESRAKQIDCISIIGRCIPGLPSPYLPFIEAFSQYYGVSSASGGQSADDLIFGRIYQCKPGDEKATSESSWTKDRVLFSALEFIKRKSILRPMIIRIEDLHWADSSSIQMLHFLARNAHDMKLLLIGTYRPEDLHPDFQGNQHPLLDPLRIMRREGLCTEIELKGLAPPEVGALIGGMLGGPLDQKILDSVVEESEGNPLYAIETARMLAMEESIKYVDGKWRASGRKEISIPPTIKEVIIRRIESIPRMHRRILDFASIAGRKFNPNLLSQVTQQSKMSVIESLEVIERDHRLVIASEQEFRFAHDMIRQVTYDSISSPRRKEMHRLVGQYLESENKGDLINPILAMHFRLAGEAERCVNYSLCAGESCANKGAALEAIPYLEQVLECAHNDPKYDEQVAKANESLGLANMLLGRYDTAAEIFDRIVAKIGLQKVDAKLLMRLSECWGGTRLGKGENRKAMEYLGMAEKVAGNDPETIGDIAAIHATLDLWTGDFKAAELHFKKAIESFKSTQRTEDLIRFHAYLSDVYLTQGKVEEALDRAEDALLLAKKTPGFYGEMEANYYAGMVHLHLGNAKEAIRLLSRSVEISTQIGEYSGICWGCTSLSLAYESVSDMDSAYRSAKRSYEDSKNTESGFIMLNGISGLLHSCVRMSKLEEASHIYREAIELQKDFKWGMHSSTRCFLIASMAEYQAASKEWEQSAQLFQHGFELMQGTPIGILLEALSRSWYAESLLKKVDKDEAIKQLMTSIELFRRLRNTLQAERTAQILKRVTG